MNFSIDYKKADSVLIPEGEYEAVISKASEGISKGGSQNIAVVLVMRNDVEQECRNRRLLHNLWMRKEPTEEDMTCGGYSAKQINTLSKCAGLENGKQYSGIKEWCDDLKGKAIRITVKHEEFNKQINARVGYINVTNYPDLKHAWTNLFTESKPKFEELSAADDLPF